MHNISRFSTLEAGVYASPGVHRAVLLVLTKEEQLMATNLEAPTATVAPPAADPAPLGLAGFALTTLLLSAANAGLLKTPGDLVWIGLAFFYGGLAQFAAGMWEFRNRNTFGATAFTTYGAFWLSLAFFVLILAPHMAVASDVPKALGWFVLGFAIFNTYMLIWASRVSVAVFLVFLTLEVTEIILFIGYFTVTPT